MEGHRYTADPITLYMSESLRFVIIHEFTAAGNRASGLRTHQEEDRDDPGGSEFKAVSCLG
ncbi:uncharacterized protein V6R79_023634 [Siganus canaliculatus]